MSSEVVYLMDSTLKGHHRVYLEALKTIGDVCDISKEFEVTMDTKRIISYVQDRRKIVNYAVGQSHRGKVLHLLYLDNLYMASPFMTIPKNTRVIGTLHHFPNSKTKAMLLKQFSKKLEAIIVHSDYIAKQLDSIGIHHYHIIDYPVFHAADGPPSLEALQAGLELGADKIVLSALGGTRFDKGLDILLESLAHLDESEKRRIMLHIAGKEETYKKSFIGSKVNELGLDAHIDLRLLSDEEFEQYVEVSDVIVVPYRKVFTGNSGPMTEGVYRQKAIIGPDNGNLGFLIDTYKLGFTFEAENALSLASAIKKYLKSGWSPSEESRTYQERLRLSHFVNRHTQLYKQWR